MPLPAALHCFASTTPGVERLLERELRDLDLAVGEVEPGGVEFDADRARVADVLLRLRTANHVLVRLASFRARTFGELERHAAKVDWSSVIMAGAAVHFRVTSRKSRLYHQDGIADRLEPAVAAAVPGARMIRLASDVEALEGDVRQAPGVQRIVVRVMRDDFTVSADAAGAAMYLRGYRLAVAKAPMRETLAAALLLASGWTPDLPLLDPMCGSGTIPIEAALLARRMVPGRSRRFAAEAWPGFSDEFASARVRALASELPSAGMAIAGQDRDAGAIVAARANADRAGVSSDVVFAEAPISRVSGDDGSGWIITNPPYGSRIGERSRLRDLYATLGQVIRERRPRWQLAMLSADRMLEAQVGLPLVEQLRTSNGGIPVRVMRSAPAA